MMLVVLAVTSATIYLAENNLRSNQHKILDAQFQNQLRSFLAVQDTQSNAIAEKCRAVARSVRLRAALEERDVDDLYANALTELQDVFDPTNSDTDDESRDARASFFRFFDAQGAVLSPGDHPAGFLEQRSLEATLAPMGRVLNRADEQSIGFIPLARGSRPAVLRQVVLTKIRDWNDRVVGALVIGFPLSELNAQEEPSGNAIKSGIWLNQQLYIDGLATPDRHVLANRVAVATNEGAAGNFIVDLESGPHLLFYKALDPETKFSPAYQVCLYPLAASLREEQTLRWKIIAFGLAVLLGGFVASLFVAQGLSKPVDKIVAGSVENLSRRQQAEKDLLATNRELEKALAELKATQKQVIQQERLGAIGQMASGIAHDFNNNLMPILGFAEVLLENPALLNNKAEVRRCLEILRTSAKDAANVVSRLREFYRPAETDEQFPIVDLAKIVEQAVSLTQPKWRHQAQANGATVTVATEFSARPIVAGDESALREVLTNLIFNAVDAMPAGGRLLLETAIEDGRAVLRVSDTGMGMTDNVRQHCLEPFFSTKGERGTGLGLSMVYGIIQRHRGELQIESTIGKGTTFLIALPLADSSDVEEPVVSAESKSDSTLNVLVVDDEERVRQVLTTYLHCDGHSVVTAASGREALEKFRRQRFDLVLMDRAMPEMNGDQTAGFIKQLNESVPVILLTGFGALIEVTGTQPASVDVVLSKPITLDVLRRTIKKLLHAA
jgi:signal transduction histidine kinase